MSDLIRRAAAIDALLEMHCKSDEDGYVWIIRGDAWKRIDALPSAQPEQQWTPVSEGLPEKSGRYLVQYGEDSDYLQEILTYFAEDYLGIPKGWHSMDLWEPLVDHSADMIAWMPLPEPWRGEEG